ncbi:C-C motif chemokine 20-like [Scyliorhinus canicula]|uniref:C-C motif chemokine 20-like n=1 Tax=Scyliorhinus canicula TaxID=7830 RepID=UPI0018F64946|nr:C-C motif chemokine 20-like [Scyliorhinus canicula]
MSALRKLVVTLLFSMLVLDMLDDSASAMDCCLRYSKKRLPFRLISGYVEQQSNEICDIDAIIFYTVGGQAICANPDSLWVKVGLKLLSKKLEEMSLDG